MPRHDERKCCIKDCKSDLQDTKIYSFPKYKNIRKLWVKYISYSDPEFAKKEDSELMQLCVCDDHFKLDQYHDNGKRKRNAVPNKITKREVQVGVPIVSYDSHRILKRKKCSAPAIQNTDSDTDIRSKIPKMSEQSTMVMQETVIKVEYDKVCRLCLATDVKMYSLNSEPFKQYFEFIKPCFDEWEVLPSENFPTTICYLCANSLKTCFEFGKICAQSHSVLMELFLISSKINTLEIKDYDKSKLKFHRNLDTYSLPYICIDPAKEGQNQDLDSPRINIVTSKMSLDVSPKSPKIEVKQEMDCDLNNDLGFEDSVTPEPTREVVTVLLEDDVTRKSSEVEINIDLPSSSNPPVYKLTTIDRQYEIPSLTTMLLPRHLNPVDHSKFGSLSFDGDMAPKLTSSELSLRTTRVRQSKALIKTKRVDKPPTNKEQTIQPSTSVTKKRAVPTDNVLSVDTNVTQRSTQNVNVTQRSNVTQKPVEDTPTLSASTIYTLKRSVFKTHGEVDVKRMFYQGGNIMVVMVNAKGKQVQLKLSRKEKKAPLRVRNPRVIPPKKPPVNLKFYWKCWILITLTNKEQSSLIRGRKNSSQYLEAPFKCTACFQTFTRKHRLLSHILKHNPRAGNYVCKICKLYFPDAYKLLHHQRTHCTSYTCKMCEETFYSRNDAVEHQLVHAIYQCPICNDDFKSMAIFEVHLYRHVLEMPKHSVSPELMKPIIKYGDVPVTEVVQNPNKLENVKWSMTCCDRTFTQKKLFLKHYREVHPGEECPLDERCVCDTCGKVFNRKKSLRSHLEIHKARWEREFVCQYCPQILCSQKGLVIHQALHKDQRFQCPNCPSRYKWKHVLTRHLRLECGQNLEEIPRPFSCDTCGKSFIVKATLEAHILALHMGVKQTKQREWKNLNKSLMKPLTN